jgi:xylulokinase
MSKSEVKYILAHDHGTSGSKAAIVSTHGKVIDFEFEETPLYLLPKGGAEQNPDEWWTAIMNTSKKLVQKNLVPIEDIVAVCCSSQWSGTVAVDADGNHLMNAIIWMDTRGAPHVKKLVRSRIGLDLSGYGITNLIRWIRKTGGAPTPSGKDSIAHILFIKDQYPEIYQKTFKFLECKDYLNLKFTGKFLASYDSVLVYWVTDNRDPYNIHYDKGLIKKTKIEKEKLPELKPATSVIGNIKPEIADELGLEKSVTVINGAPDIASAAVGSVPSPVTGLYFIPAEQETGGACLSFLRDNILYHKDELLREEHLPDVYKIFDRIVETVPPGSHNVIVTPWLYGERCPIEDHTVRGGIFNLSLTNTRADIIRAVFEGVAFNSRWILKYFEKFIGNRKLDPINMVGGGASSNIWCQIYADVLNRTIRQVKDPIQTNARGAAFIAAVALGYLKFEEIHKYIEFSNIFKPNPDNREIYDKLFKEFLSIYKNNKKMYKNLNY